MTSSVNSGFHAIHDWVDVLPFTGRVIAYQTDSYYFGAHKGYTIENVHFGYIRDACSTCGSEIGYTMTKVLKPEDVASDCTLTPSHLKSKISMRLATKKEIQLINKAITDDQAKFEYMFDKEKVNAILERNLNFLQ